MLDGQVGEVGEVGVQAAGAHVTAVMVVWDRQGRRTLLEAKGIATNGAIGRY